MKLPVTVVIPVKNEERNLLKCLERLNNFEEIVVVDSNSNDQTIEIAKKFGCTIVNFEWNGQYPKKRNWILKNFVFSTDWILFLDADEYLTIEFVKSLARTVSSTKDNGFLVNYDNYFMGKLMRHGIPFRKIALIRKGTGEYEKIEEKSWSHYDMEIHEHLLVKGNVGEIKEKILHCDYKGIGHYLSKHNEYSSWEANRFCQLQKENFSYFTKRQKIKYQLLDRIWWAPAYFITNYVLKMGFLDGINGLIFSIFKTIYFFEIYCKIREIRARETISKNS